MTQFYKLLAANMCHRGFTYKEGLNVDTLPFVPYGSCLPGGLYFTDFEHLPRWYAWEWPLIADVTVPDGDEVYEEPCGTKWKANRIVLSNIRPLTEFWAILVSKNGYALAHAYEQTEDLCLAAVRQNGWALKFVLRQTEAICRAAVAQCRGAHQFVNIPFDF